VAARASRSAGVSKRSISAPEPHDVRLDQRWKADLTSNLPQRGDTVDDDGARYRTPSRSNSSAWSAFDFSKRHAATGFDDRHADASRCASSASA